MPLPPELVSITERLLGSALEGRSDRIEAELRRREDDAVRGGRQGMGYYVKEQKDACIREINERVDAVWLIYRRIITEASVPWTDDLRQTALDRINTQLERDVPYLEDLARSLIAQHGHGFDVFLHNAKKGIIERIGAEIDLFAAKYRPTGAAVILHLQARRYSGPRQHWAEAQAELRRSPPNPAHAAREAIHAVEGMAKIVAESPKDTLGECIKVLKNRGFLDPPTANSLEALWALANAAQGLRHGATEEQVITQPQAEYILGLSEAALRLLLNLDTPTD